MKNKIATILIFLIIGYLLPLAGSVTLLLSMQVCILTTIVVVLFMTQPPVTFQDTQQNKNADKYSVITILAGCLTCQIISIVEWAYFNDSHVFRLDPITVIGIFLLACGTIFRIWSIQTLGKYFTATVKTQSNQKIITTGVYGIIRHPSYLGAYLAIVGSSFLLNAFIGIFFSTLIMLIAYGFRITVEEETLVRTFGEEYTAYQRKTKKLIPYLY